MRAARAEVCLRAAALVGAWALWAAEPGAASGLARSSARPPLPSGSATTATPGGETGPGTSTEPPGAVWSPPDPPSCHGDHDCPPWSRCEEWAGRLSCHCALGYHLDPDLGCVPVKAFPGQMLLQPWGTSNQSLPDSAAALEGPEQLWWLATQIQSLFQSIMGHFGSGYLGSSAHDLKGPQGAVIILHHFSARALVTARQVEEAVATFQETCRHGSHMSIPACTFLRLVDVGTYQSLSLCQFHVCDAISTTCSSEDGLVRCACRLGYHQAHAADRTCTACESGFWLENNTCVRCPFGFRGAACREPFLLALVVVSCIAGLLVLMTIVVPLSRRARPPQEHPGPHPLPPSTLSLPRVRPPWALGELEGPHLERRSHLSHWEPDLEQQLPSASQMKTFLRSPPASPLTQGGCANIVFVSDGEEEEETKRSHF